MMKKCLVVVVAALLLAMAPLANATLTLSVDGLPAPDEITLMPSDWIELDVDAEAGLIGGEIRLILSNPQGAMDDSGIVFEPYWYPPFEWDLPWGPLATHTPTPQDLRYDGGNFTSATLDPLRLMWGLMFHCEEETDVVLTLESGGLFMDGGFTDPGVELDSITIYQVPEPMTVALLGLGGLLLRRRRA